MLSNLKTLSILFLIKVKKKKKLMVYIFKINHLRRKGSFTNQVCNTCHFT
jgi:hypothetical protein